MTRALKKTKLNVNMELQNIFAFLVVEKECANTRKINIIVGNVRTPRRSLRNKKKFQRRGEDQKVNVATEFLQEVVKSVADANTENLNLVVKFVVDANMGNLNLDVKFVVDANIIV